MTGVDEIFWLAFLEAGSGMQGSGPEVYLEGPWGLHLYGGQGSRKGKGRDLALIWTMIALANPGDTLEKGLTVEEATRHLKHFLKGPVVKACLPTALPAIGHNPSLSGSWEVHHRIHSMRLRSGTSILPPSSLLPPSNQYLLSICHLPPITHYLLTN